MADLSVMSFLNEETQQEAEYNLKDATARESINTINSKIPSAASSNNKLVDTTAMNDAIGQAVSAAYKPAGNKTVAELTSSLLVAANRGKVYNMTDAGTTTADFVEGAGNPIRIGDDVGICEPTTGTFKFNILSGFIAVDTNPTQSSANPVSSGGVYAALASILNGENIDSFGDVEDALENKAYLTQLAPEFSSGASYDAGYYVVYEGDLYKCTTPHSGVWNLSHFSQVNLGVANELKDKLAFIDAILPFNTTMAYAVGDYCSYKGSLYRFTTAHPAGAWNDSHVNLIYILNEVKKNTNAIDANTKLIKDTVGFSGKNKLPNHLVNVTGDGTVIRNNDGTVTLNGTFSSATTVFVMNRTDSEAKNFMKGRRIILSRGVGTTGTTFFMNKYNGSTNVGTVANIQGADYSKSEPFTLDYSDFDSVAVGIYIGANATFNNLKLYPMVIDADCLDLSYEPYHNSVENVLRDNLVLESKNLIPKSKKTTASSNGISYVFNDDGSVTFVGTVSSSNPSEVAFDTTVDEMIKVSEVGTELILNGSDSNNYCIEAIYRTSDNVYISDQRAHNGDLKLTVPVNAYYIRIAIYVKINAVISTPVTVYPMLRFATEEDSTFESHHGNLKDTLRDAEVIEGKNLLEYITPTSTNNGVTFTHNEDDSMTINGTSSADQAAVVIGAIIFKEDTMVVLNGAQNSSDGKIHMYAFDRTTNARPYADMSKSALQTQNCWGTGSGKEIPFFGEKGHRVEIFARVSTTGTVASYVRFFPMVRRLTEADGSYERFYNGPLKDSMFRREEQRILGAKNLLPNFGTSQTVDGITWTVNSDDTVTANGTKNASDSGYKTLDRTIHNYSLPTGDYIFSGNLGANCYMLLQATRSGSLVLLGQVDDNHPQVNVNILSTDILQCVLFINSNKTVSNAVFNPMLRLATDPDSTYVPHAMTNKQLTDFAKHTKTILLGTNSSYTFTLPDASANGNVHACFLALMSSTGGLEVNVLAGYRITASAGNIKTIAGAATGSFDTTTGKFTITADGPQRTLTIIANAEILE